MAIKRNIARAAALAAVPAAVLSGFAGQAAWAAAPQAGATVSVVQGALLINGTDTSNRVQVSLDNGLVHVRDEAGLTTASGSGCSMVGSTGKIAVCPAARSGLVANLYGGLDTFVSTWATNGYVNGGSGDDTFESGVAVGRSAIQYQGGSGRDFVTYARATAPVFASLTSTRTPHGGEANDGRSIDADILGSDIENITGGIFDDSLIGNESNNSIIGGRGRDNVYGSLGDDSLHALDSGSDIAVNGGPGYDTATVDKVDALVEAVEIVHRF